MRSKHFFLVHFEYAERRDGWRQGRRKEKVRGR